eukprot:2924102-Prymnesium_polylepis.1
MYAEVNWPASHAPVAAGLITPRSRPGARTPARPGDWCGRRGACREALARCCGIRGGRARPDKLRRRRACQSNHPGRPARPLARHDYMRRYVE